MFNIFLVIKHPVIIDGFSSVKELADAVSGLGSSDLRLFLSSLSDAFKVRAVSDELRGYEQLAGYGFKVADSLTDLIDYFNNDFAGESINGYSIDSLAIAIEGMKYDSIADLMGYLRSFLTDFFKKPEELINNMWQISKKHMNIHEGLDERLNDLSQSFCSSTNIIHYFVILNMLRVERGESIIDYKHYLLKFINNYNHFKDSYLYELIDL